MLTVVAVLLVSGGTAAWVTLTRAGAEPVVQEPVPVPMPYVTPAPDPVPAPPPTATALVTLSPDAASRPDSEQVLDLLDRHFDAINTMNYREWARTVSRSRSADLPESRWMQEYASTIDGDVHVSDIRPTDGDSAIIDLTFVSEQDVADAPPDLRVPCIRWTQHLPVDGLGTDPRLDLPAIDSTDMTAC